jgi:hypothetical protein
MKNTFCLAALALLGLASGAHAQTFRTIALESFDLPAGTLMGNQGSGTGWLAPWYSGGAGNNLIVQAPGFDAIGNLGRTNVDDGGSYRRLDLVAFPQVTDGSFGAATGPLVGKDGSTIWISYETEPAPASEERYAGVSCFIFLDPNGVGEYLFLGTPYNNFTWGVDCPGCGGATVGTTSALLRTRLVYRLDFQPGPERVRLWTNPTSAHPTTLPEMDTTVPDFRFNELRIQSGLGGGGVGPGGWLFDSVLVECQDCDPVQPLTGSPSTASVSTGGIQTLDIDGGVANAGNPYLLVGSLSGTSPGLPIDSFVLPLNFDQYFQYTLSNPNTPPLNNSFGILDGQGKSQAFFVLPIGANPNLVGLTAHHAFAVIGFVPPPIPVITTVSNAVGVTFTP